MCGADGPCSLGETEAGGGGWSQAQQARLLGQWPMLVGFGVHSVLGGHLIHSWVHLVAVPAAIGGSGGLEGRQQVTWGRGCGGTGR